MTEREPCGADLPIGLAPSDRVVFLDAECLFCTRAARTLARFDPGVRVRLASLQSETGRRVLEWCGMPVERYDTMVFVDRGTPYFHSDAFLRVAGYLDRPASWAAAARVVPRAIRDRIYAWISRRRYRLFGRRDTCELPPPDRPGRLL